jgi:hypothetical protein
MNNFFNGKDFDVTYSNLTELTFDVISYWGESLAGDHTNLCVELELLLLEN